MLCLKEGFLYDKIIDLAKDGKFSKAKAEEEFINIATRDAIRASVDQLVKHKILVADKDKRYLSLAENWQELLSKIAF